jgi:hypothetical protein
VFIATVHLFRAVRHEAFGDEREGIGATHAMR